MGGESDLEEDRTRTLRRLAAALGVPVADLFVRQMDDGPSPGEVDALVRVFRAVRDPWVRRECISALAASAEPTAGDNGDAEA